MNASSAALVCWLAAAIAAHEDGSHPERDLRDYRHGGDHPGQPRPATAQGEHEQRDGDRGQRVGEHAVGDLQLGVYSMIDARRSRGTALAVQSG